MAENNLNNAANSVYFIWLDDTIEKKKENRDTKALIRKLVKGHLETFADSGQCIDYIFTKIATQEVQKIFFIVSNRLGPNVVSIIHDISQIQTIYVYCHDRETAVQWTKPYSKVGGIFTKKDTLLGQIRNDVGACSNNDDIPMSVFHLADQQHSLQEITEESAKFMWYQSILIVLRLMAKYCNSKAEMITECRAKYHNDKIGGKKINDFEETYEPTKAIWWYTSDSFVYRLLNEALRTQNIEIIFKFRFFINDLHNQIHELYQKYLTTQSSQGSKVLTIYRGQRMSMSEVELLKNNVNQLISMNSFLSATTIRDAAEIFAGENGQCNETSSLQSVLFIIEISDISKDTTTFAFIENYSCCPDEEEVLFTIGAIFKVKSVIYDKHKKRWHVNLQLNKQQDKACQDFFRYMRNQIGSEPGPLSFGWFLYRVNDFVRAERYAKLMLTQLPSNDKEVGNAYNLLGLIYKDNKLLEKSIECYQKALEIYSHPNYCNSSQIVAIHYNLGLAYLASSDDRSAEEQHELANSKLINSSQANNPLLIAMTESLKGKIQIVYGDYKNAYENLKLCLERKKKELPSKHASIATALNDIGIVQEKIGNDDEALKYFKQALEMGRECLTPDCLDLADYYGNIGRIHYKREQYELALEQFETALKIITDSTSIREGSNDMSALLTCIKETKEKLGQIDRD
jgi:tetratricopeptide (TPR) repeat protein